MRKLFSLTLMVLVISTTAYSQHLKLYDLDSSLVNSQLFDHQKSDFLKEYSHLYADRGTLQLPILPKSLDGLPLIENEGLKFEKPAFYFHMPVKRGLDEPYMPNASHQDPLIRYHLLIDTP